MHVEWTGRCSFLTRCIVETRDGKKYYEPGPKSSEMQRLNTSFMQLHSASSLANILGLAGMIFYGFVLADKL